MNREIELAALELTAEALEWPEAEREARLMAACADQPALLASVRRLLHVHDASARLMPTRLEIESQTGAAIPERVGSFRLTGLIGTGGMGTVWRAERDDGLFDQTVAVKLVRGGAASAGAAERFADERRILARLRHPHIAQLYDGGVTDGGLHWFAMEYLDGRTLTQAVEADGLSLGHRLKLFSQVCDAVQFAHRSLVVHADIKPSNIIVTADAGVKLLDFGIARLMDGEGQVAAATAEPLTRAYAAPERRVGAPPSVAGDVYALGVILYELLTGGLPERVTVTETRIEAFGDKQPIPNLHWTAPSSACREQAMPPVPGQLIAGDLDAITLKALAADPANRYSDVAALIADLNRYRARQPVSARPATWQYRSSRFILRHAKGLALTAAAMIGLAVAAGIATVQYLDAEAQRLVAKQRFDETRAMAGYMLFDMDAQLRRLPGSLPARLNMANQSHRYLQSLDAEVRTSPDLTFDVARGHMQLARIYGFDVTGNLGQFARARENLEQADHFLGRLADAKYDPVQLALGRGELALVRAAELIANPSGPSVRAIPAQIEAAIRNFDVVLRAEPANAAAHYSRWRARLFGGRIALYQGNAKLGIRIARAELQKKRPRPESPGEQADFDFLQTANYLVLAENLAELDQNDEAITAYQGLVDAADAINAAGRGGFDNDYVRATGLNGLAKMNMYRGRLREALAFQSQAVSTAERLLAYGVNHDLSRDLLLKRSELAQIQAKTGAHEQARQQIALAIRDARRQVVAAPQEPTANRVLAIIMSGAAKVEYAIKPSPPGFCKAASDAWEAWRLAGRLGAITPMDRAPGNLIPDLSEALALCGTRVDPEALENRPVRGT